LIVAAGAAARGVRARHTRVLLDRRAGAGLPVSELPDVLGAPVDGMSPLLTPNADFYETDITFPAPVVDLESWSLRVHGMVDRPLELGWRDLIDLGLEQRDATLVCVHNPVGGPRIGTARWLGVPLARVLARAGVQAGADQVVARSIDGFTAGVPLDMVGEESASLIAVGMNGEPLPVGHGFPARLLTPGLYGYDANTKWLGELELTTFDAVADYWTRRGWPREPARVQPSARIDVPADRDAVAPGIATVAGVAWAPPQGVTGVQVSIDGGGWQPAELGEELDAATWRQWWLQVDLPPGDHELRARTDGQDMADGGGTPPYPHGSTGVHTITVHAGGAAPGRLARGAAVAARRGRLAAAGAGAWLRNHRSGRG
jgi:DMSO/TMAO reductase YedYZ molybdopterin-dependent catalytic subunit